MVLANDVQPDATNQTYIAIPVGSPEVAERDGGNSNGKTWELVTVALLWCIINECVRNQPVDNRVVSSTTTMYDFYVEWTS